MDVPLAKCEQCGLRLGVSGASVQEDREEWADVAGLAQCCDQSDSRVIFRGTSNVSAALFAVT